MGYFFTADQHFFHRNILGYCSRPFSCIEEMNQVILERTNERVKTNDVLYMLGDVALCKPPLLEELFKKINCKNVYLIRGSHDKTALSLPHLFKGISYLQDITINGQSITLCHYAMRTWSKSHYGSIHLFAHSHGCLKDDPSLLSMDVGVDPNNFYPVSFEEVKEKMDKKRNLKLKL